MSSFSHRPATAPASLPMLSPSVRSSGAIVADPAGRVDPFLHLFESFGGAGYEDDVRARCGERFSRRGADAAARASDERKAPGKISSNRSCRRV